MAPQLMPTNGLLPRGPALWRARATTSLPVPLSPVMRTGTSVSFTRSMSAYTRRIASLVPTRPS